MKNTISSQIQLFLENREIEITIINHQEVVRATTIIEKKAIFGSKNNKKLIKKLIVLNFLKK